MTGALLVGKREDLMTHRKDNAGKIHDRMFLKKEMFYLIVGCTSILVFEWLKERVFLNKQS